LEEALNLSSDRILNDDDGNETLKIPRKNVAVVENLTSSI
jgi:hypothetical protein